MHISAKIQRATILTDRARRLNLSSLISATMLALLVGCAGTNTEAGDADPSGTGLDASGKQDASGDGGPEASGSESGSDGSTPDSDAVCPIVEGECTEGCVGCHGYRYDIERDCRYELELLTCFEPYGEFPPASPVPQTDPDGNCWILFNPPSEYYGSDSSGWVAGDPDCVFGLPGYDNPMCPVP